MKIQNNGTKIVCTIGPSSSNVPLLTRLIKEGMDVARLNFSHGNHAFHQKAIANIREAARVTGVPVGILQDLSGPKIRAGAVAGGEVALKEGARVTFTIKKVIGNSALVSTTYKRLPKDVKRGDVILLDDGTLAVRVESKTSSTVTCKVVAGGILKSNKGMNLPGVRLTVPSFTKKDEEDLRFGLSQDVDYIALSFVRSAADVLALKRKLVAHVQKGRRVPIIAKIEKPEAVANLEEILDVADGIMVARGDLGVETAPEDVPMIQKEIVRKCKQRGLPVIIATQMLESMISNPRPTRAEASDVANAVLDGADAVMLSGETSAGTHPIEAVRVMDRIIRKAEQTLTMRESDLVLPTAKDDSFDAIAKAATVLAQRIGARAIVPLTHSGATAAAISRYRPLQPILAVTGRDKIVRRLALRWGVHALIVHNFEQDAEISIASVKAELKRRKYVRAGDKIVITAGIPLMKQGMTNTVRVEVI